VQAHKYLQNEGRGARRNRGRRLNLAWGPRFVQVVSSDELKFTFEIRMELFCRQHVSVK